MSRGGIGFLAACAVAVLLAGGAVVPAHWWAADSSTSSFSPAVLGSSGSTALGDSPASIPVGSGPDALAVDSTNGTLFVANEYTNNVNEISLAKNTVVSTITVGSQPAPGALAVDAANGTAYVANYGSGNVSAISLAFGGVSASIPVGSSPDALLFNPANKDVYVANAGSGTVSVISAVTNLAVVTVPVGPDPVALALDTVNQNLFVSVAGSNNLSIISGLTNKVVASVMVGNNPGPLAFDPSTNEVYVGNVGSANVSVVGGTNHTVVASIPVGSGPSGIVLDALHAKVLVANRFSNNVSVLSAKSLTALGSIPVGSQPATGGAIALNPSTGQVFVANQASNNVSILSAATDSVAGTVPVLDIPDAVALNLSNGVAYVANLGSANVSVFSLSKVTFQSSGLPSGSHWSVSAGVPPLNRTNLTVGGTGRIILYEPNGTLSFSLLGPAGYGVARLTGPGIISQASANLTSTAVTFHVAFGPLETLTFLESNLSQYRLYSHAKWSVSLLPLIPHGGPSPISNNTTGAANTFTLPAGAAFKFVVTGPGAEYKVLPPRGAVRVPSHAATKLVKFRLLTERIVFTESGLAQGTGWIVTIVNGTSPAVTLPINETRAAGAGSISFALPLGTFNYTIALSGGKTPTPAKGSITVVTTPSAPQTIAVSFS